MEFKDIVNLLGVSEVKTDDINNRVESIVFFISAYSKSAYILLNQIINESRKVRLSFDFKHYDFLVKVRNASIEQSNIDFVYTKNRHIMINIKIVPKSVSVFRGDNEVSITEWVDSSFDEVLNDFFGEKK